MSISLCFVVPTINFVLPIEHHGRRCGGLVVGQERLLEFSHVSLVLCQSRFREIVEKI